MKLFQISVIIFCLGVFLIPKDNFYAQALQESCCKKESKSDDCCKKHHTSYQKNHSKEKSSCNDDCCTYCVSCAPFLEITSSKNLLSLDIFNLGLNENLPFQYSDPYISDSLKEIWEPPKLG